MALRDLLLRIRKLALIARSGNHLHSLIAHGIAGAVEHESVLCQLNYRTVVDIGANRGQFALAARGSSAEARIYSFEPLATPAASFRAVFAGDSLVTLHEAAIGPKRDEPTIHVSGRDDSSSLLPITHTQNQLFPGTSEVGTTKVKVAPLTDFLTEPEIEPPALLKVDVQGFELQALQGCESMLHCFAHVYVECSFVELYAGQALADEVIAWLRDRGYRLSGVHNMSYDRAARAIQGDFLFAQE